jgi:hypothetical protein
VAGNLYVWDPTGNQWRNVGQFKGDAGADGKPGDTYYLHIKYAKDIVNVDITGTVTNSANITLTDEDGESTVGAKWIGVGHSKNPVDPDPKENLELYKWTKFVTDAEPVSYKSVVFTRATADKDLSDLVPTGGTYSEPIPIPAEVDGVSVKWEDGIPTGEGIIWSTYYTFVSNVDYTDTTNTARWAKPTRMVDEADKFETAYGTADVLKNDGSIDESGLPVLNGGANPNGIFTKGWYDEPELAPSNAEIVYMATANYSNGKWSPWHILQVKGEKGDKGGSVKLSVAFNNLSDLIAYYNKPENGANGVPHDENKDNAHIIKNSNHVDGDWENHLFVWVGEEIDDNSTTDGDYFYKGWYDSGQFNGKDGKDGISSYVYIKYAKEITYNADNKTVDPSGCRPTDNGGESNNGANYIGIGHGTDPIDPVIDNNVDGYNADNWNIYKWSKISVDNIDIETPVKTAIAEYNITSNHIAAKTFDSAIDAGGAINYVELPAGLEVELFQTTEGADGRYYDTGKSATVHIGDDSDENKIFNDDNDDSGANNAIVNGKIAKGPAWQIRKDGTGHLAGGKIYWTKDGKLNINGGAIMDGIDNDTNAKNKFDTMVSKHITAELIDSIEIKTDSLETKPEGADKIYIKENYLKVLDKNGNEMCEVSSNEIPTIDKDIVFGNGHVALIKTGEDKDSIETIAMTTGNTRKGIFTKIICEKKLGYFSKDDYIANGTLIGGAIKINVAPVPNIEGVKVTNMKIKNAALVCELYVNDIKIEGEIELSSNKYRDEEEEIFINKTFTYGGFTEGIMLNVTTPGLYTLKWYFTFEWECNLTINNTSGPEHVDPVDNTINNGDFTIGGVDINNKVKICNITTTYLPNDKNEIWTYDMVINKKPNQKTIIANNGVMILNAGGGMLINEDGIFLKNGAAGFRIYTDKSDPDNPVAKIEVCTNANGTDPTYVSLIS